MGIASRGSTEAIGYSFPILGFVLVSARFFSRWRQSIPFQLDDWLCIPAWLFVTGACASLLVGLRQNAFFVQGDDGEAGSVRQQHVLAQVLASFVLFYTLANASIKYSILFFYRRIFLGRIFNICSWCVIGATTVWLVYGLLAWILYCGTDVRANFEGPFDSCPLWGVDMEMAVFVTDSVIDLAVIVLPIPVVWKLQMSLARKVLLVAQFLVGGLALVAGLNNTVVQLIYVTDPTNSGVEGASPDLSQGGDLILSNWPCIEIGVGLIACNLPSIGLTGTRMLSMWLLQSWRNLSNRGSRTSSSRNISTAPEGLDGKVRSKQESGHEFTGRGSSSITEIPLVKILKPSVDEADVGRQMPVTMERVVDEHNVPGDINKTNMVSERAAQY